MSNVNKTREDQGIFECENTLIDFEQIQTQIGILKTISHPQIAKMLDYFESQEYIYICM